MIRSVQPDPAGTELLRPADGLTLLGQYQGTGSAEPRFLVRRDDGHVIQLSRLLYLVTAAVAEGGADGGWNVAQVAARAGDQFGRQLTIGDVRYMVYGKLSPLGVITSAGIGGQRPDGAPGVPLLPHRRRVIAISAAGVLAAATAAVVLAATVTGNRQVGGTGAAAMSSPTQAAAWVAQQVSPNSTVSCDPSTCRQLGKDGFPAARLKPLPATARDPLGSALVIATPAVRDQFGSRLAAVYAPQVIASFGAGAARTDVRTVAPDGAAAFTAQLAAGHAALVSAGQQLLANKNLRPSPSARPALQAGRVDSRLLAILSVLSHQIPVAVVAFTDAAPGASPEVPLRGAEIGAPSPAARSVILSFLHAQQDPYRPVLATTTEGAGGQPLVVLRFDAPASLGTSP